MAPILEIRRLVKHYPAVKAVDDIDFSVSRGSCFGLLGPNGAGKTTTIEVIEDIIRPTRGEILYKGAPRGPAFREEVGIQFQDTALLAFLTVQETLATFGSLYSRRPDLGRLVSLCHLEPLQDRYNDRLSGGQRQRLLLALALVNEPELLFLDEPSTGLDPQARRDLWAVVERIRSQGKTVILTTHYMEEAQHLCDDIAIMDQGKIIARGSPESLIRRHCGASTVVLPKKNVGGSLDGFPLPYTVNGEKVEVPAADINDCLEQLMARGIDLSDMTVRSANLENVFLSLTGRHLRD
jgi:ABC-2 type transport system ATP-binding protein